MLVPSAGAAAQPTSVRVIPTDLNVPPQDDDDEEADASQGFLRNAVEDAKWEEKLDESITRLQAAYKALPLPLTPRFILNIVMSFWVIIAVGAAVITLVVVMVLRYRPASINIIYSGSRPFILIDILYFVNRLLFPCPELENSPFIDLPRSSNPVWKSSAHMSSNVTLINELIKGCSDYFQKLHIATHFGDSAFTVTTDPVFDALDTDRLAPAENRIYLFDTEDCYVASGTPCSALDPERIFRIHAPIHGLSILIARVRMYINRLRHLDPLTFTNATGELRFLSSVIRADLREGIDLVTNRILQVSYDAIDQSITSLIVVVVVCLTSLLVSMFINALPWKNRVRGIRTASAKLLELLPIDDDAKEMQMLPSMLSHYEPLDVGRDRIMDACQQLLDSLARKESSTNVLAAHRLIMQTALKEFTTEEKEMGRREYAEKDAHTQQHLLLRQRLTLLGDQLRLENAATTAAVRRTLVSLFDAHFTDDDLAFAETIPDAEKTAAAKGDARDADLDTGDEP
jgi:hemerythrin